MMIYTELIGYKTVWQNMHCSHLV